MESNPSKTIWILEDDDGARFVYEEIFKDSQFKLKFFDSLMEFKRAMQKAELDCCDLLIADLKLPDGLFTDFLQERSLKIPYLIVSSVDELKVIELCEKLGARDYLTKPFSKNEVLFKVNKYSQQRHLQDHDWEGLSLDFVNCCLRSQNSREVIELTRKEIQILHVFLSNQGLVTREQIIQQVWHNTIVTQKTFDVHLYNLRQKLGKINFVIGLINQNQYQLTKMNPSSSKRLTK